MVQRDQQPSLTDNRVVRFSPLRKLGRSKLGQRAIGFERGECQIINRAESIQNSELTSVLVGDAYATIAACIFKLNQVHTSRIQELGARIQEEITSIARSLPKNRTGR